MKNTLILEKKLIDALDIFSKIMLEEKQMHLKKMQINRFELISEENFGNFNMLEKEDYFVSGQFVGWDKTKTCVQYKVRANSTFKVLSWLCPFMALPTILVGLVGDKPTLWTNVLLYFGIVAISTSIFLYWDRQLRLKGEKQFKNLMQRLDSSMKIASNEDKILLEKLANFNSFQYKHH
jgi:hypothetical protein